MSVTFIIGSPRSGTTVLGNILNCHPEIVEWYEPYYMWAFFIGIKDDDVWTRDHLTPKAKRGILSEFEAYRKKSGKKIVVEKTPGHAFHIDLILEIFPDAKWIHLVRDGRDATLSIRKEWEKRARMVNERNYRQLLRVARNMLRRQPYLKYRLMAVLFEAFTNRSLRLSNYLNKSKWKGKPYWGPRFAGWEEFLLRHSPLEFNAMQWVMSVKSARQGLQQVEERNKMEIRYEDILKQPRASINNILEFLGVNGDEDFYKTIPSLNPDNHNKWKKEFNDKEIRIIKPILSPLLCELGYERTEDW